MPADLRYELEVDVLQRPDPRTRTHYVTLDIPDAPGLSRCDNEARNVAAWMGFARGDMVTAVRIISVVY